MRGLYLNLRLEGLSPQNLILQIKFKAESEIELEIIDFEAGATNTKYNQTLGSLICKSSRNIDYKSQWFSDSKEMKYTSTKINI